MNPAKLAMLHNLPQLMMDALRHGVIAYANGFTGKPFVDAHFTKSNAARYHFPPLSPKYEQWKNGGSQRLNHSQSEQLSKLKAKHKAERSLFKSGASQDDIDEGDLKANLRSLRKVQNQEIRHLRGTFRSMQRPKAGQPMLNLYGDLRKSVNSKGHLIDIKGAKVVALFRGLVDYAIYHHEGTAKMPKRSPVEPCNEDRELIIAQAKAYLSRVTGQKFV